MRLEDKSYLMRVGPQELLASMEFLHLCNPLCLMTALHTTKMNPLMYTCMRACIQMDMLQVCLDRVSTHLQTCRAYGSWHAGIHEWMVGCMHACMYACMQVRMLCLCMSVCLVLLVFVCVCLSACLSVRPSLPPSVAPCVCLSACLPVCLSVCLSVCTYTGKYARFHRIPETWMSACCLSPCVSLYRSVGSC